MDLESLCVFLKDWVGLVGGGSEEEMVWEGALRPQPCSLPVRLPQALFLCLRGLMVLRTLGGWLHFSQYLPNSKATVSYSQPHTRSKGGIRIIWRKGNSESAAQGQ